MRSDMELTQVPDQTDIFVYRQPRVVDVLSLSGSESMDRSKMVAFTARESDVEGCVNLFDPQPLKPRMSLKDVRIPVLALLDHLASLGWVAKHGRAIHGVDTPREYDDRRSSGKRSYYQCLVALPELLQHGVTHFDSMQPTAYYRLVLLRKKDVPLGLGNKAYQVEIAQSSDDQLQLALLEAPVVDLAAPPPPLGIVAPGRPALQDIDIAGDSSESEGDANLAIADGQADEIAPIAEAAIVGDDEAEVVAGAIVPGVGPVAPPIPDFIMGVPVTRVQAKHDSGWSYFARLRVACPNPAHPGCNKSRSLELLRDVAGPRAAEWYLGAWLSKQHLPHVEHKAYRPTLQDIRGFGANAAP